MSRYLNIVVRNNLEDLHAGKGPISDSLMKEINQRIRNAIYTGLHAARWQHRSLSARKWVDYHLQSIPSYWEAAELIPGYRDFLEPETDGARPASIDEASAKYKAALDVVRAMLERIAATPEGHPIRGARGAALRSRMERFAVDRYLKFSPDERQEASRVSYLEANIAERIQGPARPGHTKQSGLA